MKIGVLAYHSACNFGANLQVFSTIAYLRKHNYNPIVINWVSEDLEKEYNNKIPECQALIHKKFVLENFPLTKLCRTELDIARIIQEEKIEAIIIGSDAVAQHHSLISRIIFPSKHIISIAKHTRDRMFPNPFWGTFNKYLEKKIPIAALSISSQNSDFIHISQKIKSQMEECILKYKYISVRDSWTQEMFKHISKNKVIPPITPDPVFAFNYNLTKEQFSERYIKDKFSLPDNYILISFLNNHTVSNKWLKNFEILAKLNGFSCVALPFPNGILFNNELEYSIKLPLSPLEWYALIKYSKGYIGDNMHPIIVCLHNSTPFFSFDHYGITRFRFFVNEKSSKTYHILKKAEFLDNRVSSAKIIFFRPKPEMVFNKIINFNKIKCEIFSKSYYINYHNMMNDILNKFNL